jgi:hypothetical protein
MKYFARRLKRIFPRLILKGGYTYKFKIIVENLLEGTEGNKGGEKFLHGSKGIFF